MTQLNVQSSYWKIDQENNKTSAYIPTNTSLSKMQDIVAIGSNYQLENLKVYQLSSNALIHLASITLPDIQALEFLQPTTAPPDDFKFLLTGHSDGIANLCAIPLLENSAFESAEIIKRFNHKKHLEKHSYKRPSLCLNNGKISTNISTIKLTNNNWRSTPLNSMISIYDHHVFLWNTSRSRHPSTIIKIENISDISVNNSYDSLTAVVGDFGLSLLDIRTGENQLKTSIYKPEKNLNYSKGCSKVEWCETDPNYLATVHATSNIVHLWDIRKLEPITQLKGFNDSVTNIKWRKNTLWTGDDDGTLIKWNLNNLNELQDQTCTISTNKKRFSSSNSANSGLSQSNTVCRGTSMKISSNKIISLTYGSEDNNDIICLDDEFLSIHELNKFRDPKPMKRICCNTTQPVSCSHLNSNSIINEINRKSNSISTSNSKRNSQVLPLPLPSESRSSISFASSNSSSPLFDTFTENHLQSPKSRNISHQSISPYNNHADGGNNIITTDSSKSKIHANEYIENIQKEINDLINNFSVSVN